MKQETAKDSAEVTETKQRIWNSTLAEVRRSGVLGLRVADVAHGAGVSVPLIYKYFGDRDGLIATVVAGEVARAFLEEIAGMEVIGDKVADDELFDVILRLIPKPDDPWRHDRRWLRLEAKAAARSIPALRASLNDAISDIEDATATLIDKVRNRCGNKSTVPARTIAWMLNSFSDGFTNSDLKREPLTDEHYLPLLRGILKEHVF